MPAVRLDSAAAPETLSGVPAFTAALRRDFTGYLLSLGLINLGNVLLLPLITAYLSAADLGLYSLVETAQVQGVTFSLLGLKFAYLYYYAHLPAEERPGLFGSTLILSAAASLIGGMLLWALFSSAAIMGRFDTATLADAWILAPLLLLGVMQTILLTELRAARQVWLSGTIAIVQLALTLLVSVILVALYGWGLTGLLVAQTIAGGFSCAVAVSFMRHRIRLQWRLPQLHALLRYGLPMMGSLMLRYSLDTLCRFLLASLVSIEAAGIFMVASRVASVFDSLLALPFFTAWGGLVHHAMRQPAAPSIVGRVSGLAIGTGSILFLLMLVLQPRLFGLLAHAPMHELSGLFALLLLARAVQLVRSPLTAGILVTGRTGWAARNSLFGLAVFLILLYPAARLWQTEGMAAAVLVAHIASTVSISYEAWRHCRPRIDPRAILLGALAILGTALSLTASGGSGILPFLLGAALVIGFLAWRHATDADPV